MKRISDRARRRYAEAKPIRDALRDEALRDGCEVCQRQFRSIDIHEICRGVHRQKALDKRFALLAVCRSCHDELGSASVWPEARQLAVLAERRPLDFDLPAYLELTSPKAPRRIEPEEVIAYMSSDMLSVTEVADHCQVNRKTVQRWIDSRELPACDLRPTGAQRALWKIAPSDLMAFIQTRRTKKTEGPAIQQEEDLLT